MMMSHIGCMHMMQMRRLRLIDTFLHKNTLANDGSPEELYNNERDA
jgi:hypothetical protein